MVTQLFYDTGVAYGDEVPDNFPESYAYLVAMYASIQSLHAAMTAKTLTTLSINTVPPDVPVTPSLSFSTASYTTASYTNAADDTSLDSTIAAITDLEALSSAPTYTPPKVGGATEELTTTMDTDSTGVGTDADFLNFSKWFSVVSEYIEDQEDAELAGSQLAKINTYLSAYGQAMTNQLNEFNEANVKYQAEIKEHLQESANEMTRVTTLYNKITDLNLQNAKNTSNLDYQNKTKTADIDLQNKMQTYKAELDTYVQKIARFSAEITAYSADVTREVQEHTANFQNDTTDYTWMQGQLLLSLIHISEPTRPY